LNGNFNKNYRLPLKSLYGRRILENRDNRKELSDRGSRSSENAKVTYSPTSPKLEEIQDTGDY